MTEVVVPRPALRFYGSKWTLAPWLISFFPAHKVYVEPCMGACNVLLRKRRAIFEIVNDADSRIVNFFRVLRDEPDEFVRRIEYTPYSREEFYDSLEGQYDEGDPIERARKFFVLCWMSMQGATSLRFRAKPTWRVRKWPERGRRHGTPNYILDPRWLKIVARRLKLVNIEHADALAVIKRYDHEWCLQYVDPPYLASLRTEYGAYEYEWTDEDHRRLAELLYGCKSYFVVSGYSSELYTELFEDKGWVRKDRETVANAGVKRIESVWLSPNAVDALNAGSMLGGMFGEEL